MITKQITRIAIGLALLIVASQLSLPIGPVPITLQSLVVLILALSLPLKESLTLHALYLVLGLIGLPVFANFTGGWAAVLKPSFGFILSFLVVCLVVAGMKKCHYPLWLMALLASLTIYLIGIPYMAWVLNGYLGRGLSLGQILSLGMFPFLIGDLLKAVLAVLISRRLRPLLESQTP